MVKVDDIETLDGLFHGKSKKPGWFRRKNLIKMDDLGWGIPKMVGQLMI